MKKKFKDCDLENGWYIVNLYSYCENFKSDNSEMEIIVKFDKNKNYVTEYMTGFKIPIANIVYEDHRDSSYCENNYFKLINNINIGKNLMPIFVCMKTIYYSRDKLTNVASESVFLNNNNYEYINLIEGKNFLSSYTKEEIKECILKYNLEHSDDDLFRSELKYLIKKANERIEEFKLYYSDKKDIIQQGTEILDRHSYIGKNKNKSLIRRLNNI